MDTDVSVEITDITDGCFHPASVLSADPQYRTEKSSEFYYNTHNGIIPHKNAVLASWLTITTIPCHVLRFACRGRRKLLFKVCVLADETGETLVSDQQVVEYVSCRDGYKDIQDRKLEVIKSSVQLAVIVAAPTGALSEQVKQRVTEWLDQKAQSFPFTDWMAEWIQSAQTSDKTSSTGRALEWLMAYGDQNDRLAVIELILQMIVDGKAISAVQADHLIDVSRRLGIQQDRLLSSCQKMLLMSDCQIENPSFLLGIDASMDEETYRSRLNQEYRKWNARVTHPDERIRRQADRMLNLIADLRSCHTSQVYH
ncbi:MAG: hypothetical protein H8E62_07925 [Planctomycetes bacterium]|nr:hypothetical protein [Planctomycetota bacterium]